jgi:YVTN family beta-propeller protein
VLEFRILGPLEVGDDDRPVALGGPRQRALLAILLLHRGEVVSSDRIIDELWGDRPPATAAKTLQGYVSHLRKALGPDVLVTRGGGYQLVPERVDADRFDALVDEARDDDDARRARERLGEALALWRGEPLADLAYEPFAQGAVARLEEARLAALEDRIDADLALGRQRALVGELEALVNEHPNRERLLGQLMVALYRSGRQADALAAYRAGRRRLHEELALEPGPELRELERRILEHDPALAPARTPAAARARPLIAVGAALLLGAAIAAGIVVLAGGRGGGLRAGPNTVAALDVRTNRVVAAIPVGARPGPIAFGSGSLWVANLDDQTISRVDPRARRALRSLPLPAPPTGLVATAASVWVVGSRPGSTTVSVNRIDPQFDAIGPALRLANAAPGTAGAAASAGDALWVAPFGGALVRLDARTGRIVRRLDPNAAPTAVAVGAGAVWMTDADAANVTRIDPTGLVGAVPVGHDPHGIAVGAGGVWVADTGDDAVVRIDPSTRAVTTTIPVGHLPVGVTVGAGAVWVADSGDGTVTRIDPRNRQAVATIPVGGSPQAIVVAGDRAWVTVDARTLPAGGGPASGGTARLEAYYDVDPIDPPLVGDARALELLQATCARLLSYPDRAGPAGAELVPEVAQALPTRSADGKSYTFAIREGFRFSPPSNAPVTAETFKATIERSLSPRMKSGYASQFRDIVGARAYMSGRAAHIAGVIARGDKLTIRLTAPAGDLPARMAEPVWCAVPPDTPIDPRGVRLIPSAGPYRVVFDAPGQGIVLTRNPNYHGPRPHRLARIELTVGVPERRAIADVEAGRADYAVDGPADDAQAAALAARYGQGTRRPRYFVTPVAQLDFIALNTHRRLFADVRLRKAVNYAIDRTALAKLGDEYVRLPEHPTDRYLPPGVPGHTDARVYPLVPDVRKARRLAAGHAAANAVLYTCDRSPCHEQAQIVRDDLAAIGVHVTARFFPDATLLGRLTRRAEPVDMAWIGWLPDYLDPDAMLNVLLSGGRVIPTFEDPRFRARLAAASRLLGARRSLAYARLDVQLARDAAPWVAIANLSSHDFFSARMGCEVHGVNGVDLAALCLRR